MKWSLPRLEERKQQKDILKEGQIIESYTLHKHYVFILRQWKVRKGFNQKSDTDLHWWKTIQNSREENEQKGGKTGLE